MADRDRFLDAFLVLATGAWRAAFPTPAQCLTARFQWAAGVKGSVCVCVAAAAVPTARGRAAYGPHYKALAEFELMHLNAAGDRAVDHIHDGMGIATQHISMTGEFELALQAVDVSLAVPYWDYTYDAYRVSARTGVNGTAADRISVRARARAVTRCRGGGGGWFSPPTMASSFRSDSERHGQRHGQLAVAAAARRSSASLRARSRATPAW